MTKWYFDTIEEAKAAMPGCDAIYTPSLGFGGCKDLIDKFRPTKKGVDLDGDSIGPSGSFWIKVKETAKTTALDLIPFIEAHARGEKVSCSTGGKWINCGGVFVEGSEYRIEPKTILVNGFEVPEPMREAPEEGVPYFIASVSGEVFSYIVTWERSHSNWLERGICHLTKEAAITHAKAMLGIDPKSDEEC